MPAQESVCPHRILPNRAGDGTLANCIPLVTRLVTLYMQRVAATAPPSPLKTNRNAFVVNRLWDSRLLVHKLQFPALHVDLESRRGVSLERIAGRREGFAQAETQPAAAAYGRVPHFLRIADASGSPAERGYRVAAKSDQAPAR